MTRALFTLAVTLFVMSGALTAQTAIVPYSSTGYRFLQVSNIGSAPVGFQMPGFNDSSWLLGCAPFGPGCNIASMCTAWSTNTTMLLRKQFDLPNAGLPTSAVVEAEYDNEVQIWINGVDVTGFNSRQGCAGRGNLVRSFNTSLLTPTGNTLAVLANDFGNVARIDVEVRGNFQPTYMLFGQGCAGSAGVPALQPQGVPALGNTFQLDLVNLPAGALAYMAIGFDNQTWMGQTLPVPLGGFGLSNCKAWISVDAGEILPVSGGTATWTVALPGSSSLAGFRFFNQGVSIVGGAAEAVSNAGEGVIQ